MFLGYIRASTEEQRSTLDTQERMIRGLAMMRGVEPFDIAVYIDAGVSGAVPLHERPHGQQLLEIAKSGDVVVATKLDRMFRSAVDALQTAERFRERSIDLVLLDMGDQPVTGKGVAKFFFTMVSAFAEMERERIAERMEEGRKSKRRRNGFLGGGAPYGFRVEGRSKESILVPVPEERAVIERITKLADKRSLAEIVRDLTEGGIVTRTGKPFHIVQVKRILEHEYNHG